MGFRPFVHRLALSLNLKGFARNVPEGLLIEIEGQPHSLEIFIQQLRNSPPPFSIIESISISSLPPVGYEDFKIEKSKEGDVNTLFPLPDIATCSLCLEEIFSPSERRYFYPFTNCTNCGPRFTIIRNLPYDRERTSMRKFKMCDECREEYEDINDRRYHAQPIACPKCGPHIWLEIDGKRIYQNVIDTAVHLLLNGKIVAIKGLGGFHLACNALDEEAVKKLRKRKQRPYKPFAVMVKDIQTAHRYAYISSEEEVLLLSPQAPIVLLRKKEPFQMAPSVAPKNSLIGLFLPYTPLHHILLNKCELPLIMTSGNLSDNPICSSNEEARKNLQGIADAFLFHNRDIVSRCDDSVVIVVDSEPRLVRRSRGYVPLPLPLPINGEDILACGGDLKNTFCLAKDKWAFLSQHIGDLESADSYEIYKKTIKHFKKLLNIKPKLVVYDLHPSYHSSIFARSLQIPSLGVQHHFAHIVSCMVDNEVPLDEKVLGVAWDGTGYGLDGRIWGGEIMLTTYRGFQRLAHLLYIPLPGGELAVREPWRVALSYLTLLDWKDFEKLPGEFNNFLKELGEEKVGIIRQMVNNRFNSPLASSIGRLFDAVASILGISHINTYEGQAASELNAIASECDEFYEFHLQGDDPIIINPLPLIYSIIEDLEKGKTKEYIASRFHRSLVEMLIRVLKVLRQKTGINLVALSGGVFQNSLLLETALRRLREEGFQPLSHRNVPTNDGGIALGQVAIARALKEAR
ncbi:carbamoyltransferase HypF [bacterium]|nr:carbamoyltransferase HypF [bacterium]